MTTQITILSAKFGDEGVRVRYGEIYPNGLWCERTLNVPFNTDYDDEIDAVAGAITALVADVLDDTTRMQAIDVRDLGQPDDDADGGLGE